VSIWHWGTPVQVQVKGPLRMLGHGLGIKVLYLPYIHIGNSGSSYSHLAFIVDCLAVFINKFKPLSFTWRPKVKLSLKPQNKLVRR
jgi:hypothetical protein